MPRKPTRDYKKIIAGAVVVAVGACALIIVANILDWSRFGNFYFVGYELALPKENILQFEVNSLSNETVSARVTFWVRDPKTQDFLVNRKKVSLVVGTGWLADFSNIATTLEFKGDWKVKNYDRMVLFESEKDVSIPAYFDTERATFFYPFEGHCIQLSSTVKALFSGKSTNLDIGQESIDFSLPNTWRVRQSVFSSSSLSKIDSLCTYQAMSSPSDSKYSSAPPGLAAFIDHPWWYKAFIILLMVLLAIPAILIFRASLDSISMDMLAGFIAIATIRSLIFSTDMSIHLLDMYMAALLIVIMVAPLVRWAWPKQFGK